MADDEIRRLDEEGHLFRWNNIEEALDRRLRDLLKDPADTGRPRAWQGEYKGAHFFLMAFVTDDRQKADDLRRNVRLAVEAYLGKPGDEN